MSSRNQTILVTGGAGYIGSHAVLILKKAGYNVIILDNLSYGHREIVEDVLQVKLVVGDTSDRVLLDHLFTTYKIDAVMHFAAYIAVGESVNEPGKYYRNNVASTLNLLEAMLAHGINQIVFSSTCAVYGMPKEVPMSENHPHNPLSPYAASKDMVERILSDFDTAFNLKSVAFRYFNACGADKLDSTFTSRQNKLLKVVLKSKNYLQKTTNKPPFLKYKIKITQFYQSKTLQYEPQIKLCQAKLVYYQSRLCPIIKQWHETGLLANAGLVFLGIITVLIIHQVFSS